MLYVINATAIINKKVLLEETETQEVAEIQIRTVMRRYATTPSLRFSLIHYIIGKRQLKRKNRKKTSIFHLFVLNAKINFVANFIYRLG